MINFLVLNVITLSNYPSKCLCPNSKHIENITSFFIVKSIPFRHLKSEVLPRFELGSTDSKSDVLTVTP